MDRRYRGSPPPLKDTKNVFDVIAPRPGEQFDLTLLDSLVLGTDCHWVVNPETRDARSRLCTMF